MCFLTICQKVAKTSCCCELIASISLQLWVQVRILRTHIRSSFAFPPSKAPLQHLQGSLVRTLAIAPALANFMRPQDGADSPRMHIVSTMTWHPGKNPNTSRCIRFSATLYWNLVTIACSQNTLALLVKDETLISSKAW